jgi:hypothetical protein
MQNGNFTHEKFLAKIADVKAAIVTKTKDFVERSDITQETSIISPTDNKPLVEGLCCDSLPGQNPHDSEGLR